MYLDRGCYVIAEIGVNHNGSLQVARNLIDVAAESGADAVKFQTFRADDLVTIRADRAGYQTRNMGSAGTQHEMLSRLELRESDFEVLSAHCATRSIDFLSTPFGPEQADLLERVGVEAFKVSSGDLTYVQFLAHLARKGRPIILSTGMGTLGEVEEALAVIDAHGPVPVALLHCVSDYPAAAADCNLAAIETMRRAFNRSVGWSDHTLGSAVGFAAVALGATIIEKHITLDVDMEGPDHAASMAPQDFASFVSGIRAIESALGDGEKRPTEAELQTSKVARRSIVTVRPMSAGTVISSDDVAIRRPGTGLEPQFLDFVLGLQLVRDVDADSPLMADDFRR